MTRLVAGVDSSTQSCKVVVCDADTGEVVREARAAHPDGTEVHPDAWWSAWQEATAGGLLDGVSALAVGGQQHGMVLLDDDDQVVRPALLWNDTRSASAARDLVSELGAEEWARRTGVVPVAAITAAKLRWMADQEPDALARARTCVLPHDWLTGRILAEGGVREGWTTDRGDASGTGYWSAATGAYDDDLLTRAAGRLLEVPVVRAADEPAGTTRDGLLVAAGTGDNMGAALGLGLDPGETVVSLGTSGTVFARHHEATGDARGEVASYADATGGHLPLVCTLNAARVLSAGAAMLGTDLAGLDDLALASEPGAGGLVLLPYLDGERTPNLPQATGSLHGLTRANATPEHLARAVVEGMLLNLAGGIEALRREGVDVESVLLIGGAAGSRAVRALAPDLLGLPVVVPDTAEYVALGAARQAAWALDGGLPSWAVSRSVPAEPTADLADVRAAYAETVAAVHG
ncbi:xylulokinase [Alteromonas gracilis]